MPLQEPGLVQAWTTQVLGLSDEVNTGQQQQLLYFLETDLTCHWFTSKRRIWPEVKSRWAATFSWNVYNKNESKPDFYHIASSVSYYFTDSSTAGDTRTVKFSWRNISERRETGENSNFTHWPMRGLWKNMRWETELKFYNLHLTDKTPNGNSRVGQNKRAVVSQIKVSFNHGIHVI